MADTNWIKLNRKIWENFIWSFEKPQYALAWIDMLLMANYMDKQILFNGKVETIQRGSFVTSMLKLSVRWNMNRKTVKSFLDMLQDNGMITYSTTKRRTTVFVSNYLAYQGFAGFDGADTGQLTGQPDGQLTGQLTGQPDGHNIRRLKNIKEGEEGEEKRVSYQLIADMYNETCVSFPKIKSLSDSRKKAIKARLKNYTEDDFRLLFKKAEESDFLKGKNSRDWSANFDWLIKDANMAKVLDGNYDNNRKGANNNGTTSSDTWSAQRIGNHV